MSKSDYDETKIVRPKLIVWCRRNATLSAAAVVAYFMAANINSPVMVVLVFLVFYIPVGIVFTLVLIGVAATKCLLGKSIGPIRDVAVYLSIPIIAFATWYVLLHYRVGLPLAI